MLQDSNIFCNFATYKKTHKSSDIKREPATRCSWLDDSLIP